MDKYDNILITRRITDDFMRSQGLKRIWTPKLLWMLGVGTALSGSFAREGLGIGDFGPLGLMTVVVIYSFIFIVFAFIVSELAVHFPYAGGSYAYARRGLGRFGGYLAGTAAVVEFNCAAAVVLVLFKDFIVPVFSILSAYTVVVLVLLMIMLGHIFSLRIAVAVQVFLTFTVVSGVILFFMGSFEALQAKQLISLNSGFSGWRGVYETLPYVIWLFLGFETMTTVAEETDNPQRNLPKGIIFAVFTLVIINLGVMYVSLRAVSLGSLLENNYPLLSILGCVQSEDRVLLSVFFALVLCSFLAGLNGLINGYSRQVYALSRAGYFPYYLSRLQSRLRTPYAAIIFSGFAVLITAIIVPLQTVVFLTVISVLIHHVLVFISFSRIRQIEPELFRRWKRINYSLPLIIAFSFSLFFLGIVIWFGLIHVWQGLIVYLIAVMNYFWAHNRIRDEAPEESLAESMERKNKVNLR